MKKYKNIALAAFMALISGCSDILDIKPTTFISDAALWEDAKLINQFVANTYGSMLCGFNRCTAGVGQDWSMSWAGNLDSGTNDIASVSDSPIYMQLNKDAITAQSCPFIEEIWQQEYVVIRKCNIIIAQLPSVAESVLTANEKKVLDAEMRFLRAFCHFELARTFGKAPLMKVAQDLTDDLQVPPSSFEDIIHYIKDECDTYANNLPLTRSSDEVGRATKGAFLALKSRALLYLASPLNNTTGDTQKWADAAKAAQDVINLNIYHLYKTGETPYYSMAFDKTATNEEIIFERRFTFPEAPHNIHMMWSADVTDHGSWNGVYPTQNLVDAYETTNGMAINDPANTLYDPQNPYANRDARFYQSILYHGLTWEGDEISMLPGASCEPKLGRWRCGYGLKKLIEELPGTTNIYGGYAQSNNFPYFRYAEILLNYAEAQNEALSAPDKSVYNAINEVRERAGLPSLPTGLTKDAMRERIKNERRVELLMEEHRFYDLRRWLDGNALAEPIMGMKVYDKNGDGVLEYVVSQVEERAFTGTNYYLPIPLAEQEKNPLLREK